MGKLEIDLTAPNLRVFFATPMFKIIVSMPGVEWQIKCTGIFDNTLSC